MSRCLGRKASKQSFCFGDVNKSHTFKIEERCVNPIAENGLCKLCYIESKGNSKNFHGFVSGPFLPDSNLYDSKSYHLNVKIYGEPSEVVMARAKKAKEDSRLTKDDILQEGVVKEVNEIIVRPGEIKPKDVKPTEVKIKTKETKEVKPKRKYTKKVEAISIPIPIPIQTQTQTQTKVPTQAIESREPIVNLEDKDVLYISVRLVEIASKKYYLDSKKEKVYTYLPSKGVGHYCGRFDRENDCVEASFPDSDSEL